MRIPNVPKDPATVNARNRAAAAGLHVATWMNAAAIEAAMKSNDAHSALINAREKWEANKTAENKKAAETAKAFWEKSVSDSMSARHSAMKAAGLI